MATGRAAQGRATERGLGRGEKLSGRRTDGVGLTGAETREGGGSAIWGKREGNERGSARGRARGFIGGGEHGSGEAWVRRGELRRRDGVRWGGDLRARENG